MALNLGSIFYNLGVNTSGLNNADKNVKRFQSGTTRSFNQIDQAAQSLKRTLGTLISIEALRRSLLLADNYALLKDRVRSVVGDIEKGNVIFARLEAISEKTGASLLTTAGGFQKLEAAKATVKGTTEEMITLTRAFSQLGLISGTAPDLLNAAMLQFSQGLVTGTFQAQEFQSVLENVPGIAREISQGMGITIEQLIKLKKEGRLVSEDVFRGLLARADAIAEKAEKMPIRLARGFSRFRLGIQQALAGLDETVDLTGTLGQAFQDAGDSLQMLPIGIQAAIDTFKDLNEEGDKLIGLIQSVALVTAAMLGFSVAVKISRIALGLLFNLNVFGAMAVGIAFLIDQTIGFQKALDLAVVAAELILKAFNSLKIDSLTKATIEISKLKFETNLLRKSFMELDRTALGGLIEDPKAAAIEMVNLKIKLEGVRESLLKIKKEQPEIADTLSFKNQIVEIDRLLGSFDRLGNRIKTIPGSVKDINKDISILSTLLKPLGPLFTDLPPIQLKFEVPETAVENAKEVLKGLLSDRPKLNLLEFGLPDLDIMKTFLENFNVLQAEFLKKQKEDLLVSLEDTEKTEGEFFLKRFFAENKFLKSIEKLRVNNQSTEAKLFRKNLEAAKGVSVEFAALAKAQVIFDLAVKTPQAIGSAFTHGTSIGGIPLGIAFAAIAGATMGAQIAQASSIKFSPKAGGGDFFPNSMHKVNENGPEMFSIGGNDFLATGNSRGTITPAGKFGMDTAPVNPAPRVNIKIFPTEGQTASVQQSQETDGSLTFDIIMQQADAFAADGIKRGTSALSKAITGVFGVSRVAGALT